jgi:hypothetical protein
MSGDTKIAGPVVVVGLRLLYSVYSSYLYKLSTYNRPLESLDSLWGELELERAIQDRCLVSCQIIDAYRFRTNLPNIRFLRTKVELAISELYTDPPPHIFYLGNEIPASPGDEGTRLNYTNQTVPFPAFLSRIYAELVYRQQMREVYHPIAPYYDWNNNLGASSDQHWELIFKYGPKFPIHKEESIIDSAKHWYKRMLKNDWWALTQPIPPKWWEWAFPDLDFFHSLAKGQKDHAERVIGLPYSKSFMGWLWNNKPNLKKQKRKKKAKGAPRYQIMVGESLRRYLKEKSRRHYDKVKSLRCRESSNKPKRTAGC